MMQEKEVIKKIAMHYDSIEHLIEREPIMNQTLKNYLKREKDYEFYRSYVEYSNNTESPKCRLVLEIKLKNIDGNN